MTSNPSFGTVVETVTSGSCVTTTTTACVTAMPMNAQCEATTIQTTSVNTTQVGCGGGGGGTSGSGCCGGSVICSGDGQKGDLYVCDSSTCSCTYASPIVIDTTGRGFHMTSSDNGVTFDILGDGRAIKIGWPETGSGNAFLALDRNHNGRIDNGKELFGNHTEQPASEHPNGYLALEEFDKPENGGNADGIIDSRDAIFKDLRLWIDENHDGISQPNELHTLPELGVYSIGLRYKDEHYTDEYGNWFHYRSVINPDPKDGTSTDGRYTYDVFFVADRSAATCPKKRSPTVRDFDITTLDSLLR
jgi:hypothetical protein